MGRTFQVHLTGEDEDAICSIREAEGLPDRAAAVRLALAVEAERLALGTAGRLSAVVAFAVSGQSGRRSGRRVMPHGTLFNLRMTAEDEAALAAVMAALDIKQGEAVRYCVRMRARSVATGGMVRG